MLRRCWSKIFLISLSFTSFFVNLLHTMNSFVFSESSNSLKTRLTLIAFISTMDQNMSAEVRLNFEITFTTNVTTQSGFWFGIRIRIPNTFYEMLLRVRLTRSKPKHLNISKYFFDSFQLHLTFRVPLKIVPV